MGCFGYDTFTNGVNSDETIGWQHTQFIKRFYRFLIVKNFFFIEKNLTSESSSRLLKDWRRRRRRRRRTDRIHSSLFMAITDAQLLSKAPNIALLQWILSAECIRSDIIKQKKNCCWWYRLTLYDYAIHTIILHQFSSPISDDDSWNTREKRFFGHLRRICCYNCGLIIYSEIFSCHKIPFNLLIKKNSLIYCRLPYWYSHISIRKYHLFSMASSLDSMCFQ